MIVGGKNWERKIKGHTEGKHSTESWTKLLKISERNKQFMFNYSPKWKRTKTVIQRRTKETMCEMKYGENEAQFAKNKILKISAPFYTELYSSTQQDRHCSTKIINPDTSGVPPIRTSEVRKTLKELINNKAPSIDNLTSDAVIPAGEGSAKQIIQKMFIRF